MAEKKDITAPKTTKEILDSEPKVRIKLFKDNADYKDDVFLAINGVTYQIQRGVSVDVPESVAALLDNIERQTNDCVDRIEKLSKKANAKELS